MPPPTACALAKGLDLLRGDTALFGKSLHRSNEGERRALAGATVLETATVGWDDEIVPMGALPHTIARGRVTSNEPRARRKQHSSGA